MKNGIPVVVAALLAGVVLFPALPADAKIADLPSEPSRSLSMNGMIEYGDGRLVYAKSGTPGDTTWIRVYDDRGRECTRSAGGEGGQGTGAPAYATWCWESDDPVSRNCSYTHAYSDTVLPGCFDHFDVYYGMANQWHLDAFEALSDPSPDPDWTPWCGEFGDTLYWSNDWGYGPNYYFSLVLNLGLSSSFDASAGFSIGGVHMYDVETNYDYCFLEYTTSNDINSAIWQEIARYNGTSFATPGCPDASGGGDYGCANYGPFLETAPPADNSSDSLLVRWRFDSDTAWDDEDANGGVHTDGAWRIDNVYATAVAIGSYGPENFESGVEWPSQWSAPILPQAQIGGYWSGGRWVNGMPVWVDWWHLEHDPTYKNRGVNCSYSNNWMFVADDPNNSQNREDGYHYRLTTPVFECGPNNPYRPEGGPSEAWTGVVLEYDRYYCAENNVGDVLDQQVRVFDRNRGAWERWGGDYFVTMGGCENWDIDFRTDWSSLLSEASDSIQFSWEFLDRCDYNATDELPCMGYHRRATYIIDNVSVGVFETRSTQWLLAATSSFIDSYARDIDMHSAGKENWELRPLTPWAGEDSLQIEVRDFDGIKGGGVKIHWRISTDCGDSWDRDAGRELGSREDLTEYWNSKVLHFSVPDDPTGGPGTIAEFDGAYRTRIEIAENNGYLDNGTLWPEGTVLEYFFTAEDSSNNIDTFPNRFSASRTSMDYVSQQWDRRADWPFEVSILPCPVSKRPLPPGQNHPVLLIVQPQGLTYDVVADLDGDFGGDPSDFATFTTIWEESLDRLGIVYDRYDVANSGESRGPRTPYYTQPFDPGGYGGVLDHRFGSLQRRYRTVIASYGRFAAPLTLYDSAQLEVADYLDIGLSNFVDGANFWITGDDLCEDDALSDPAWVNGSGQQTTNSAYFWTTLAGLAPVAGGCPDSAGITGPPGTNFYPLSGVPGTIFENMTAMVGQWDCPILDDPDIGIIAVSAVPVVTVPIATPVAFMRTHFRPNLTESKVFLSTTPLEVLESLMSRDCWSQAVLNDFGVGIPNPVGDCTIDVGVPSAAPARLVLYQNRPNPFNPATTIRFALPTRSPVELKIYDITGREVKTIVNGELDASPNHEFTWFGEDNSGREVGSGVFFYQLIAGEESLTRKMVLMR